MGDATRIDYPCPHCGDILHIRPKHAGTRGTCKHCGGTITVPKPYSNADLDKGDPATLYAQAQALGDKPKRTVTEEEEALHLYSHLAETVTDATPGVDLYDVLNKRAVLHRQRKDYAAAIADLERAQDLARSAGDEIRSSACEDLLEATHRESSLGDY
jgi:hypothetical protein